MITRFFQRGLCAVLIASIIFIAGCTSAPAADYTRSWTEMNASGGWTGRTAHSSAALADGSIVLMGGEDSGGLPFKNDTWKSVDNGATWILVNVSSGWQGRYSHSTVALPDNSIVLTGGYIFGSWSEVGDRNDTWRSTDGGATWMLMNASSGWEARSGHSSVSLPDGSIVIMGGRSTSNNFLNDVWRSTDKGASWKLVNSNPGWTERGYFSSVVMADGSIVLIGGLGGSGQTARSDVWRSPDKGSSWILMNASPWTDVIMYHSSVVMPDDSIVTIGGYSGGWKTEVWRSMDKGAIWTLVNANPGWSSRGFPQGQTMPDGSIILIGGDSSVGRKNDTWRFNPAGSSAKKSPSQNPETTQ